MKSDKILDKDFAESIQEYFFEKEEIEWEGVPNPGFSITFFEFEGMVLPFIFTVSLFFCTYFYLEGNFLGFCLAIIICVSTLIIPEIFKYHRRINTKYAFTKNRVFFQLWRRGKSSVHIVDLADIEKVTYVAYEDKDGILYFFLKAKPDFFTYDFDKIERRHHPTFEMIPNVIEVHKTLEGLIKKRKKDKELEGGEN